MNNFDINIAVSTWVQYTQSKTAIIIKQSEDKMRFCSIYEDAFSRVLTIGSEHYHVAPNSYLL